MTSPGSLANGRPSIDIFKHPGTGYLIYITQNTGQVCAKWLLNLSTVTIIVHCDNVSKKKTLNFVQAQLK